MYGNRYNHRSRYPGLRSKHRESDNGSIKAFVGLLVVVLCVFLFGAYNFFSRQATNAMQNASTVPMEISAPAILKPIEPVPELERMMPTPEDVEKIVRKYVVEYYTMESDVRNYIARWKKGEFLSAVSDEDMFQEARKSIYAYFSNDVSQGNGVIRRVQVVSMARKSASKDTETWELDILFSDKVNGSDQDQIYPVKVMLEGRILTLKEYKEHIEKLPNFKEKNPFGFVVSKISGTAAR